MAGRGHNVPILVTSGLVEVGVAHLPQVFRQYFRRVVNELARAEEMNPLKSPSVDSNRRDGTIWGFDLRAVAVMPRFPAKCPKTGRDGGFHRQFWQADGDPDLIEAGLWQLFCASNRLRDPLGRMQ